MAMMKLESLVLRVVPVVVRDVVVGRWRHSTTMTTPDTTDGSLSGRSRFLKRFPARVDGRALVGLLALGRKREQERPGARTPARGMPEASIGGR